MVRQVFGSLDTGRMQKFTCQAKLYAPDLRVAIPSIALPKVMKPDLGR